MDKCNTCITPIGLKPLNEETRSTKRYQELSSSLMYLMVCVHPDLSFAVDYRGRFQQNPSEEHWKTLKRILRYLNGIKQNSNAEDLVVYADIYSTYLRHGAVKNKIQLLYRQTKLNKFGNLKKTQDLQYTKKIQIV